MVNLPQILLSNNGTDDCLIHIFLTHRFSDKLTTYSWLFCGKVPDFAYIIQPTKKECFSPKYHRFHALDFWLESPPWVDFPMPSRSQENEVPQSSAPAEVYTTTASSGSEDAAPGVTTPIVIKHSWEFHGDLWSKWSFFLIAGKIMRETSVRFDYQKVKGKRTLETIDLRAKSSGLMSTGLVSLGTYGIIYYEFIWATDWGFLQRQFWDFPTLLIEDDPHLGGARWSAWEKGGPPNAKGRTGEETPTSQAQLTKPRFFVNPCHFNVVVLCFCWLYPSFCMARFEARDFWVTLRLDLPRRIWISFFVAKPCQSHGWNLLHIEHHLPYMDTHTHFATHIRYVVII